MAASKLTMSPSLQLLFSAIEYIDRKGSGAVATSVAAAGAGLPWRAVASWRGRSGRWLASHSRVSFGGDGLLRVA